MLCFEPIQQIIEIDISHVNFDKSDDFYRLTALNRLQKMVGID